MTALLARRPQPGLSIPRLTLADKIQNVVYSAGLSKFSVGIVSALYVLVTQATYFGFTFKYTWDNLATTLHVQDIPRAGPWMVAHFDLFRHIYWRDSPESIVAFALVAMIVIKARPLKDRVPLADRVMVFLKMPSRYQGQLGRHEQTSGPQIAALLPSMLLASLPGQVLASVAVFGGMALAHRAGYQAAWLNPGAGWVPVVIGIAGGAFFGHRPASKAGYDIQEYFLGKRLAMVYGAGQMLQEFAEGKLSLAEARDRLTSLPGTRPGRIYPGLYRRRYQAMLEAEVPARKRGPWTRLAMRGLLPVMVVLGFYGLYIRMWGVKHGFWMP